MPSTSSQTNLDVKALLAQAAKMKIQDLESFARDLNGIITRKKTKNKDNLIFPFWKNWMQKRFLNLNTKSFWNWLQKRNRYVMKGLNI